MIKKSLAIVVVFCLVVSALLVWWFAPVSFLNNINPGDISSIEVIGGETGGIFTISDPNDIKLIIENIQNISLKKTKVSILYSGSLYGLTFMDHNDNPVQTLVINSATTIRKDPFFYYDDTASLCIDYLEELERNAAH